MPTRRPRCACWPPPCSPGAGCGRQDDVRDRRRDAQPQAGGTVVIGIGSEPDVLNSLTRTSAVAGQVLSLMQAGLAEMGEDLQWQPMIADRWELAPDSLAITFHLRPWALVRRRAVDGAGRGRQLRVAHRPAGRQPARRPGRRRSSTPRRSIRRRSATSSADRLARPLDSTVHSLLPWHVVRGSRSGRDRDLAAQPRAARLGTVQLQSWEHNRQLVLVPNPRYPLRAPWLERVVLRIMPDETARMLALEMGDVDVVTGLNPDAARRLAGNPEIVIHEVPGRTIAYVLWNLRQPQFADPRVRRALSLAIDRDRIVGEILQGQARQAASLLPPAMWNHHRRPGARPSRSRGGAAAPARGRLGGSGRRRGVRAGRRAAALRVADPRAAVPALDEVSVLVRENLREIGVDVTLRRLELAVMTERLRAGEFSACLLEFVGEPVGRSVAARPLASDRSLQLRRLCQCDRRFAAGRRGWRSRAASARCPLWYRLQEMLAADPPAAVLYYPHSLVGVNARVRGVRPHMLSPYNNLQDWWIAPDDRRWRGDH